MATDQLLHLAGASSAEGVQGPAPGGWQAWAKAVSASSAGCGPPGAHATPGDDASGAELAVFAAVADITSVFAAVADITYVSAK